MAEPTITPSADSDIFLACSGVDIPKPIAQGTSVFSFTTLTTIGYGDIYPVTVVGKIFTMAYSVIGLGIMASFLAVVVKKLDRRK